MSRLNVDLDQSHKLLLENGPMTVAELIEALKQCPQDSEVLTSPESLFVVGVNPGKEYTIVGTMHY